MSPAVSEYCDAGMRVTTWQGLAILHAPRAILGILPTRPVWHSVRRVLLVAMRTKVGAPTAIFVELGK